MSVGKRGTISRQPVVVPEVFSTLRECPSGGFRERTRVNVIDSDATLILVDALPLVGGTGYTAPVANVNQDLRDALLAALARCARSVETGAGNW